MVPFGWRTPTADSEFVDDWQAIVAIGDVRRWLSNATDWDIWRRVRRLVVSRG
jgi:hypothetical protein